MTLINKKKSQLTLFISDLHLEAERPDITQAFLAFIENIAPNAEALYILGDFFNVWIGDDKSSELTQVVSSSLKQLADSGTYLYLMHGNRDFLLGQEFADSCGAKLIFEPYTLEVYGKSHLLLHGDSLCTLDTAYMQFRSMVRSPAWQQDFLSKPLSERQAFADQARAQSKSMSSNKPEDIMDVTPNEVLKVMSENKVNSLIHGHTHRPAIHNFALNDGSTAKRTVLADWEKGASYIELNDSGIQLVYTD